MVNSIIFHKCFSSVYYCDKRVILEPEKLRDFLVLPEKWRNITGNKISAGTCEFRALTSRLTIKKHFSLISSTWKLNTLIAAKLQTALNAERKFSSISAIVAAISEAATTEQPGSLQNQHLLLLHIHSFLALHSSDFQHVLHGLSHLHKNLPLSSVNSTALINML